MKRSLQITGKGGPEVFHWKEENSHPPESHEVQIQVRASGVNFADIMMRQGLYPEAPRHPFVPGYEIAGEISEVGSSVKTLKKGDRVFAGTRFGGYASEIVLPEAWVRKIPSPLSFEEAAAIPVNFLTAWVALYEMGRVRTGDRVVIQSAAGGVGIAALQLSALAGAQSTGLVSRESKFDIVRSFGASQAMTYSQWDESSQKADLILDNAGGKSLKQNLRRLNPMGKVVSFGAASIVSGPKRSILGMIRFVRNTTLLTPFQLMMKNQGIYGLNLLSLMEQSAEPLLQALEQIIEKFEQRKLRVSISKTFPMGEAGAAHNYLQSRAHSGKVILIP